MAESQLEGVLTCSICLDRYTDPKILPCHHSFCKGCLEAMATTSPTQGAINCPSCRTIVHIPTGGVANLPASFTVISLLEALDDGYTVTPQQDTTAGDDRVKAMETMIQELTNENDQLYSKMKKLELKTENHIDEKPTVPRPLYDPGVPHPPLDEYPPYPPPHPPHHRHPGHHPHRPHPPPGHHPHRPHPPPGHHPHRPHPPPGHHPHRPRPHHGPHPSPGHYSHRPHPHRPPHHYRPHPPRGPHPSW